MEHFTGHSRYEGMTYGGIRDLLSEADYEIACTVEIRRLLHEQGLSWTDIAKALNEQGVPLPARSGKGTWTGPKVKALMA